MDKGLGRVEEFDERSRAFSIHTSVEGKKFRSYTWRCNEQLDQGPDGACVGFGLSHEAIARPAEMKGVDYEVAMSFYYEAQKIDPWEGGSYPGADPFYEGTSVLAGLKVGKRLGWYHEYRWAFDFPDMARGVGYNGPAVIGVAWYEDMFTPDDKGFIKPTGDILGGHCVLVRAINVKKEYLTIRNSWGSAWGVNGDCYITFDDMEKLLSDRGEAAFCIRRHTVADPEGTK